MGIRRRSAVLMDERKKQENPMKRFVPIFRNAMYLAAERQRMAHAMQSSVFLSFPESHGVTSRTIAKTAMLLAPRVAPYTSAWLFLDETYAPIPCIAYLELDIHDKLIDGTHRPVITKVEPAMTETGYTKIGPVLVSDLRQSVFLPITGIDDDPRLFRNAVASSYITLEVIKRFMQTNALMYPHKMKRILSQLVRPNENLTLGEVHHYKFFWNGVMQFQVSLLANQIKNDILPTKDFLMDMAKKWEEGPWKKLFSIVGNRKVRHEIYEDGDIISARDVI